MKIIDHRKDFYDFTCGMYDTDDSIVYVRKTQCLRHNITDEKTFEREVTPLLKINDAYPKMIIARTRNPEYQYEGVKIVDVADWLLNK